MLLYYLTHTLIPFPHNSMANRDVALGLTGVVVGVLLGAGSVLYTEDATLGASSTDVASAFDQLIPSRHRDDVRKDAGGRFLDAARTNRDGNVAPKAGRVSQPKSDAAAAHKSAPASDRCALVTEAYAPLMDLFSQDQRKYSFVRQLASETLASYCK